MTVRIGIDTGGTFTDFIIVDGDTIRMHKVLSTPHAPEQAILSGLGELGLLGRADVQIVHGSTVATNAVLEGKGARTAFVTNHGFADLLTIGRQARAAIYDLNPAPIAPPVAADLCLEVGGRTTADGELLTPISADEIALATARLSRLGVEAIAVNLLFSFKNKGPERMLAEAWGERWFVTLSSDILPEYREYERGIATWLNAFVGPRMQAYISALAKAATPAQLRVLESSGGTSDAMGAARRGVHLLLSGPAGGVRGALACGHAVGRTRLLGVDIGGTSTDVAIVDGEPRITLEGRIGHYPVAVPMTDIHTVGAGGGSIAGIDNGGLLRVGPQSAGADPGPACYGRGGREATVTDAHVVLGRIPATARLGGRLSLNVEAARHAVARLADQMQCSLDEAATGIIRLTNEHMAAALRVISVQRGIDPQDYTLIAFGGGGGLHACELAEALGMREALVPAHAGALSALGMVSAPAQRVWTETWVGLLNEGESPRIDNKRAELEATGRAWLAAEGIPPSTMTVTSEVELRYLGQAYGLRVIWQGVAATAEAFRQAYAQHYGYHLDQTVEVVRILVTARGEQPALPLEKAMHTPSAETAQTRTHEAETVVRCLPRTDLRLREGIDGPAIVVDSGATTWVARGWNARATHAGHLFLCRTG